MCKRELKDPFKDSKSAPPLIYHGNKHYPWRICLAHVLRMSCDLVNVSSPSPKNSGRQTRHDGRSSSNVMELE